MCRVCGWAQDPEPEINSSSRGKPPKKKRKGKRKTGQTPKTKEEIIEEKRALATRPKVDFPTAFLLSQLRAVCLLFVLSGQGLSASLSLSENG